jgi:SAM-dependent methyltransferase
MSDKDMIRSQVSEFYTNSVKTGCGCGPGCCGPTLPQGVAVIQAGYGKDETTGLPEDAVANSFGCGNPLAFSGVEEGQTVLDLGSGAGIDLLIAAKKVGPTGRVIGVDMTDEMIVHARKNISAAGAVNIEVRKGVIEELPVESGTVDWVISNCVINLSPEKERVFKEIARVLKPGGRISISDIVADELPDWLRQSAAMYGACVAGAVSEDEYLDGLRRAGLTDVEVTERFVYDTAQIQALVASEIPTDGGGCCGNQIPQEVLKNAATEVAGKVWSAKFSGRKP